MGTRGACSSGHARGDGLWGEDDSIWGEDDSIWGGSDSLWGGERRRGATEGKTSSVNFSVVAGASDMVVDDRVYDLLVEASRYRYRTLENVV